MNYSMLGYFLRYIVCAEGLLMLLPTLVSVIYREKSGFAFVITIVICLLISFPFTLKKPKDSSLKIKEGLNPHIER